MVCADHPHSVYHIIALCEEQSEICMLFALVIVVFKIYFTKSHQHLYMLIRLSLIMLSYVKQIN